MKIKDVIAYVDRVKPNTYTMADKLSWLSEVEGLVQTEVFLWEDEALITYQAETDPNTVLLVRPPHDKIYRTYLAAMIDFANGEYDRYANTMAQFKTGFSEYAIWFADRYRPADGGIVDDGYFGEAAGR